MRHQLVHSDQTILVTGGAGFIGSYLVDAIELDFVEDEATPKEIMKLVIHLYLGGLSLSNTV